MSAIGSSMSVDSTLLGRGSFSMRSEVRGTRDFTTLLAEADPGDKSLSPKERARAAAEAFVGDALVLPILKQARETSDAAPPFNRGKHEEMFGSLMDQAIATRIVRSENFPLVDRVAEQLDVTSGKRGGA
jgi:Rod binding domain-containing protein